MSFYLSRRNAYLVWSDLYYYPLAHAYINCPLETRQAAVFARGYNSARYYIAEMWNIPASSVKVTIVDIRTNYKLRG